MKKIEKILISCFEPIQIQNIVVVTKSDDEKSFYLIKDFKFKDFEESQKFVNKVSYLAEEENHHPDINFGWGYCKVKIFTHAIKGLAESDFILAAKIDKVNQ